MRLEERKKEREREKERQKKREQELLSNLKVSEINKHNNKRK